MGAWIEISLTEVIWPERPVAPLVGAWIEIFEPGETDADEASLLSWERGLKFLAPTDDMDNLRSLLSWERGLKSHA